MIIEPQVQSGSTRGQTPEMAQLRARAEDLETAFLSEMLRHAGLASGGGSFSGGIGEEQFASFLREGQARAVMKAGGLGLAEQIFRSLATRAAA